LKDSIQDILYRLDRGEINSEEAVNLIRNIETHPNVFRKKASRLKIIVVDKDENKSIKIPAIPFWLLDFLLSTSFGICSIVSRFSNRLDLDEDTKTSLELINNKDLSKDLKMIFKEMRQYGTFNLVDIKDGDGTIVKISVL
jgi:hypothetical protein